MSEVAESQAPAPLSRTLASAPPGDPHPVNHLAFVFGIPGSMVLGVLTCWAVMKIPTEDAGFAWMITGTYATVYFAFMCGCWWAMSAIGLREKAHPTV